MGVTYSFLCSFKPFMIKPQQKKRPFWKSFGRNPLKAEISNTSGSKQALETSSTRDHMAKLCQDLQLLLEPHAAFLRHFKCLSSAFETPQMLWGCSGCIYQPKQSTILTSLAGRSLGVMVPFHPSLLRISALLSRRSHCCHWVTSMMQPVTGVNQRTHHSVSFCRALHLLNNRFSNTLQLYPSLIHNDFILGWPPLSSNVATNDLCTRCPIALENPQRCGSSMLETSIKSSKH